MTRKQAVLEAINILSPNKENEKITEKLQEILEELPSASWTKNSIVDAIENYAIEHDNRLPYERELTSKNNMPSSTVIYNKFGIRSIRKFYEKYFPHFITKPLYGSPYGELTQSDLKKIFVQNYNRIKEELKVKNVSNKLYNFYKTEASPCVETIMRNCNCNTYNELLILCAIKKGKEELDSHVTITYNDEDEWQRELETLLRS